MHNGPLLAVLSAVAGGSTPPMVRAAASHIGLAYYASIRAAFAFIFVLLYSLVVHAPWNVSVGTLALSSAAGLLNMFIASLLLLSLIRRSSVHLVVPLANTAPFWGVVLSVVLLGERASISVFASGVLVVAGASLLLSRPSGRRRAISAADLLQALAVGALFGLSNVVLIKLCLQRGMHPAALQVVFVGVAVLSWGAVALVSRRRGPSPWSWKGVALACLHGFIGFFVARALWFSALEYSPASSLSPFRALGTPVAFLLGIALLKERPTVRSALGVIGIFAGVSLAYLGGQ